MEPWIAILIVGIVAPLLSIGVVLLFGRSSGSFDNEKYTKDNMETRVFLNKEIGQLKEEVSSRISREYGELKNDVTTIVKTNNEHINQQIAQFGQSIQVKLSTDFKELNTQIEKRLNDINQKVEERLTEGFKQTNETFQNIADRITKIDEAQKNIQQLSISIVDLQGVLTDKKTRGLFGEVQLKQLLSNTFGYREQLYKNQQQNNKRQNGGCRCVCTRTHWNDFN
jgi:DNA recombination protein RmuC